VLLRVSVHVAISLYSVISIIAGVMSLLLPIETKGREMTVSGILILIIHSSVICEKISISVKFFYLFCIVCMLCMLLQFNNKYY